MILSLHPRHALALVLLTTAACAAPINTATTQTTSSATRTTSSTAPTTSSSETIVDATPAVTPNDCRLLRRGLGTVDPSKLDELRAEADRAAADLDVTVWKGKESRSLAGEIARMRRAEGRIVESLAQRSRAMRDAEAVAAERENEVRANLGEAFATCDAHKKKKDECVPLLKASVGRGDAIASGIEGPEYVPTMRKVVAAMRKTKVRHPPARAAYAKAATAMDAHTDAVAVWQRERVAFDAWRNEPANAEAMRKSDAERRRLDDRLAALCADLPEP